MTKRFRRQLSSVQSLVRIQRFDIDFAVGIQSKTRYALYSILRGGYTILEAQSESGVSRTTIVDKLFAVDQEAVARSKIDAETKRFGPYRDLRWCYHALPPMESDVFHETFKQVAPDVPVSQPLYKAAKGVLCDHAHIDYMAERHRANQAHLETTVRAIEAHIIEQDILKEFE